MKRLLPVCLLMLCLSFPVFGGHTVGGGYGYCECDNPASHETTNGPVGDDNQESAPELGLFLLVLAAFMLRYKA